MSLQQQMHKVTRGRLNLPHASTPATTRELVEGETEEVLAFLSENPVRTVSLAGLVRDNGVVSEHHRGTFWGCRDDRGRLEGVALVGHHTLVEARTRRATREFALVAQSTPRTFMMMGELERMEEFWNFYADEKRQPRLACRELLLELRQPVGVSGGVEGLRLAAQDDLELIVPVQGHLAEIESGLNPLNTDAAGFRARCLRRIELQRTWVVLEGEQLIFKAEVQADTPDVIYLEGIYVSPEERGTGVGRKCLAELCRRLLRQRRAICLLVNEENERAHHFYRSCGFRLRSVYDTIFLQGN